MSSILSKLKNLQASTPAAAKTQMTDEQVSACKAALVRDNRGYNVQPNKWDLAMPYRVAINYNNAWANFGNFKSVDVAAAVGAIVSAGYFGENARVGSYDESIVDASEEFKSWMADARNATIIAQATGEQPCVHGNPNAANPADDANPF
jgi:hypothetical protein